jgi:hypothetical protein
MAKIQWWIITATNNKSQTVALATYVLEKNLYFYHMIDQSYHKFYLKYGILGLWWNRSIIQ